MTTRRQFIGALPATSAAFAFGSALVAEPGAAQAQAGPALQPGPRAKSCQ